MHQVLVVKAGGRLLADQSTAKGILEDLASIASRMKVVFVHGGGDLVTEYSRRMGVEPRFVVSPSGIRSRYTSREELEVYVMVMAGKLNTELTAFLSSLGVKAIGLSGADCGLLRAARKKRIVIVNEKGRPQVIPGGYTGRITGVNVECIDALLHTADVLVVTPLALGEEGELLNVDGDQAAAKIASALRAQNLILLTDVPGVIIDGRLVEKIPAAKIDELVKKVGYGMNRKLLLAKQAIEAGVGRVVISDGRAEKPITRALKGNGTTIE